MEEEKDVITDLIETGSEISGSVSGALLGLALLGPPGAVAGAAFSPLVTKVLKVVGLEVRERLMGPREKIRIGAAYAFAIDRIVDSGRQGKSIRTDGFFESNMNYRSTAEEVLEGVLLAAQKQFQEKKVKHIGWLYGNIATDVSVDDGLANRLIRTSEVLSYRQYCILQTFHDRIRYGLSKEGDRNDSINELIVKKGNSITRSDILLDIGELIDMGLLKTSNGVIFNIDEDEPIPLSQLFGSSMGRVFCDMLSLDKIEVRDIMKLINDMGIIFLDEEW